MIIDRLLDFERSEDRFAAISIALLVPSFALIGVAAALSEEGPRSGLRLAIAAAICLTTIPVGIAMSRLVPGRSWWRVSRSHGGPGAWFVLYADIGVAGVLFTFVDFETAMYGTALFAVVGSYASHVLGSGGIVVHVCFVSVVVVVLGVLTWRQGQHDAGGVIARCLTSLIVVSAGVTVGYLFTNGLRRILSRQFDEAARDPLTGLWNRRGFATLVKATLVRGRAVTFIVLDVDRFKRVNDQFGHSAGDEVLKLLGERLRRVAGMAPIVARTGGEEFALAVQQGEGGSAALAERVRGAIYDVADDIPVTVSVGVCRLVLGELEHGTADPAQALLEALRTADHAMYEAKAAGGNCVVYMPMGSATHTSHERHRRPDAEEFESD